MHQPFSVTWGIFYHIAAKNTTTGFRSETEWRTKNRPDGSSVRPVCCVVQKCGLQRLLLSMQQFHQLIEIIETEYLGILRFIIIGYTEYHILPVEIC